METRDQEYLDRTEAEIAVEYAEIAASYDVPVTLFITGQTAREEPERIEQLAAMETVESRWAQLLGVRYADTQRMAGCRETDSRPRRFLERSTTLSTV